VTLRPHPRRLAWLVLGLALGSLHCGSTEAETGGAGGASGSTGALSGGGGDPTGAGGGPTCDDPPAPADFELGTGESCFERVTSGQTVPTLAGPQGGYHVWAALGCGDCGSQALVELGVKDPATSTWYAGTYAQKSVVQLDAEGWGQIAGLTAFLPGVVWDPESNVLPPGTHVVLAATVFDGTTIKHAGEVELVLGEVEPWSPPCDPGPDCGQPGGAPCCYDDEI
jgi:hypothetical protein